MGKLYLIEAAVDADYTWLGVGIAIGTMISLAYYLRVVAAIWMRPTPDPLAPERTGVPAMAGGSPEADELPAPGGEQAPEAPKGTRCIVILSSAAFAAGATVFFGIIPSPLVDWASHAGQSLAAFIS
jgi:NADH-quinone oxidoreductase subunit N